MGKQAKKKTAKLIRNTDRIRYPEDEAANPWLSVVLDVYHIQDTGIAVELQEEQKKRKDKLGCHRGCGTCCLRPTVPVTDPEVKGIVWFVAKKLPADVRETVQAQLLIHRKTTQCPFLVNSVCSIYPVRPIACRILLVFGEPCVPNEDIYLTRPKDIWVHSRDIGRKIALTLLPLYGITGKKKKIEAFESGYLNDNTKSMLKLPWEKLCGLESAEKDS
mgnify:FL=1